MATKRVLIVEDNFDNRAIYSVLLQHAGYDVLQAPDGEEGVRLASRDHPDVILMDLSMPVLDGWQALKRLKSDPDTASIPVFALSAHVHSRASTAAGPLLREIARVLHDRFGIHHVTIQVEPEGFEDCEAWEL